MLLPKLFIGNIAIFFASTSKMLALAFPANYARTSRCYNTPKVSVSSKYIYPVHSSKAFKVRTRFICKFILSAHQLFLVKIDKNQFTFL
jgi:hypothetical protein